MCGCSCCADGDSVVWCSGGWKRESREADRRGSFWSRTHLYHQSQLVLVDRCAPGLLQMRCQEDRKHIFKDKCEVIRTQPSGKCYCNLCCGAGPRCMNVWLFSVSVNTVAFSSFSHICLSASLMTWMRD